MSKILVFHQFIYLMNKWFSIIIYLNIFCICNLTAQVRIVGNDNLSTEIRNLTINYVEWFSLSGFDGRHSSSIEQNFRTLFSEGALHFNFLPGTRYYLSETNLDNYINGLKEIYHNYTVYPGVADYRIEEVIKPLPTEIYQVKVSVTNYLHVYSNEGLDTVDISLLLEIYADLTTNTYQIVKVADNSGDFESLSFKLIDIERKPVKGMPVFFSYSSPTDSELIIRKRYPDDEGRVKISSLPGYASLVINAPEGYSFTFSEERTVAEWKNIPEKERLLIIKQQIISSPYNRSWIMAGVNRGLYVNDLYFRFAEDFSQKKQVNYSRLNPGFSFNYAFLFVNKTSFGVALGTGINYSSLSIDSNVEFYKKSFPFAVEPETGANNLRISSSEVQERYYYESWNIPVFLTFRVKTNKKLLSAIDLTASVSYFLSQSLSYESVLSNHGVIQTDFKRFSIDINDRNYRHKGSLVNYENEFIGKIKQQYPVSYGARLSLNIPVVLRRFWIQSSVGYQLYYLGNGSGQTEDNDTYREYDRYTPSLGYGTHYIGILGADLGLLLVF